MKKKRKVILLVLTAVVLILAITALCLNSHCIYIVGEYLGLHCKKIELVQITPESTAPFTLSELESDSRVTFDQNMMLINDSHPIDEDFAPTVSEYNSSGVIMNDCIQKAYYELSDGVNSATGSKLLVSAAYRTRLQQQKEFEQDPNTAAAPGSNEHQAGLALDVYVPYYASYGFLKTEAGRYVNSNCWQYGFIIRYPVFGKSKTGMKYEPWHIRYVGMPHASIIYNNKLTLEEYVESLKIGCWYSVGEFVLSRRSVSEDGKIELPSDFESAIISPDNTGAYIITLKK